MIETHMIKRRAYYKGELGLFPAAEVFEQDLVPIKFDDELVVKLSSPRHIEALRYLWGLVHLVANNTDRYLDKDEAMEDLKIRAAFTRVLFDREGKLELRPKSLTKVSDQELRILTGRISDIICREILPGMKADHLRREVEEMVFGRRPRMHPL